MLKKDKATFLDFVSGDTARVHHAVVTFNQLPRGYFEDHPPSSRFVKEHIGALVRIWNDPPSEDARSWVMQFVTDAGIVSETVRPLVMAELSNPASEHLPTLLYLISTAPELFADAGPQLLALTLHNDREVRWRIAYVISKMAVLSSSMRLAVEILSSHADHTTQVYVRECQKKA